MSDPGFYSYGVLYFDGLNTYSTPTPEDGQIVLGNSEDVPAFVTPTVGSGLSGTFNASTFDISFDGPVSIANGGTNASSMTNSHGSVYYDGSKLASVDPGNSGQVLTSNGSSSAPSYQSLAASVGNSVISTANPGFSLATIASTSYIAPWANSVSLSPTLMQSIVPSSGSISNMYVWVSANLSTSAITVTLNVNGSNSSLTVSVPALTTGTFSDTTHSVSVSAGDKIQWEISASLIGIMTGSIVCQLRS